MSELGTLGQTRSREPFFSEAFLASTMPTRCVPAKLREFLSNAITQGDAQAVRDALSNESDCQALSADGLTPLMEAARAGKTAIARLILSIGADVNARAKYGATALILAASRSHSEMVDLLLRNGASVENKTHGNKTALDVAAAAGDWASMKLLHRALAAARTKPVISPPASTRRGGTARISAFRG